MRTSPIQLVSSRLYRWRTLASLIVAPVWLPVLGLLQGQLPGMVRLGVAAFVLVSAVRPDIALLVAAALLPLGSALAALFASPYPLTEPLALALLAGWSLRLAAEPPHDSSEAWRRLARPALVFTGVIAASMIVTLAIQQHFVAFPGPYVRLLLVFLRDDYLAAPNVYAPIGDGVPLLVGLGVFMMAVDTARAERVAVFRAALPRMLVVGAAGVAALATNRLLTLALRGDSAGELLTRVLTSLRISAAFPDPNAAGSYLALMCLLAIGLATEGSRGRRLRWGGVSLLLAAALVLSGSRAALLVAPVCAVAALLVARSVHWRTVLVTIGIVSAASLAVVANIPADKTAPGGRWSMSDALESRWELSRAAMAITGHAPVFGAGIGRFRTAASEHLDPEFARVAPRENAHNNFLQILAELGLAGFLPFVVILAIAARLALSQASRDPAQILALAAVAAFLATCLAGHPLLIREVAFSFWLTLGALVVRASDSVVRPVPRQRAWRSVGALALAVLLLVGTVPWRIGQGLESTDLTEAVIGMSGPAFDDEGLVYRRAEAPHMQFYVPAHVGVVPLSLRLAEGDESSASRVSIFVDGRLANRADVLPGAWQTISMRMPTYADSPFRRVELRIDQGLNALLVRWPSSRFPLPAGRVSPDFSGDNESDLILRNYETGQNVVWAMKRGAFHEEEGLPPVAGREWQVVAAADFTGDGRPDVAWRNTKTGQNVVWQMDGLRFVGEHHLPPEEDPRWTAVAAGDANGDGHTDLYWRNRTTGQNVVWYLEGTSFKAQALLPPEPDAAWQVVAAADMDADGGPDLVWRNGTTGDNRVWYMDAGRLARVETIPPQPETAWRIAAVQDLSGDGKPDLVWRHARTGENQVWWMNNTRVIRRTGMRPVPDVRWVVFAEPR